MKVTEIGPAFSSQKRLRIAVVGSRGFTDWELFSTELDRILSTRNIECLVSGGAVGADQFAERYGALRGIPVTVFPADWNRFGSKAGPKRNKQIVTPLGPCGCFLGRRQHRHHDDCCLGSTAGSGSHRNPGPGLV